MSSPIQKSIKKFPKILTTIFLLIFILQLASLIFLLAVPEASQAADVKFKPQVGIPVDKGTSEYDFSGKSEITFDKTTGPIAEYIKAIYKYALGIVGILATVVMMFGGVLWITAGGNAERVTNAKSWLTAALTGLVLALTSYMILYIVNPGLVQFRVTPVKTVEEMEGNPVGQGTGCCIYESIISTNPYKTQTICVDNFASAGQCTTDKGYINGNYTANAKCSGSSPPTCIKTTADTGIKGCCEYDCTYYTGDICCNNNVTENWCTTEKSGQNPSWDEGIDCSENIFCDHVYN